MDVEDVEELFRDSSFEQIVEDIKSMRIRGAGRIGRAAAWGLRQNILSTEGHDDEGYSRGYEYNYSAAETLYDTRPTAVSLANALLFVLKGLQTDPDQMVTFKDFKQRTSSLALDFNELSINAVDTIALNGKELVPDGGVVQTICNSTAVVQTLIAAHKEGKDFLVRAAETRPRYQGRITARQLVEAGIRVELCVDNAIRHHFSDVDLVLVGADTVCKSGELFNKIGTSNLAAIAKDHGVPFYTCAEWYKISTEAESLADVEVEERASSEVIPDDELHQDIKVRNPAFDATKPDLISGIITDEGIIQPGEARELIKKHFGTWKISGFIGPDD